MHNPVVKIKHPKLGEGTVAVSSVPVWEARGWKVVDADKGTKTAVVEARKSSTQSSSTRSAPTNATRSSKKGDSTAPAESA